MAMLAAPLSRDISRLFTQVDVPGVRDPSDHITLFYLGEEIPIDTVGKLVPIIHQVTSELQPFIVSCKRITTFPKGENGYPVIAQLQAPQLQEIREKIKRIFDRKGIKYDETHADFNPHVTLSYSKKKPKNISFPKIQWQINELALFGGDSHDERIYVNFPFNLGIQRKAAYIDRLAEVYMKNAGLSQAKAAKEVLKTQLGKPEWLRGIGIGKGMSGEFTVRVNVASPLDLPKLPKSVNGVPVDGAVVGVIRPQSDNYKSFADIEKYINRLRTG